MKKVYVLFFVSSIVIFVSLEINFAMGRKFPADLSIHKVEALAEGEDNKGKYDKNKGDCEKEFDVDADGYVVIFGKKNKVGSVEGTYRARYTDVQIDCPVGSTYYSCKECSCADFWQEEC